MSSYPRTNVICIVASERHSDQQWRFVMNIKVYASAAPLRHRGLFTLCASFILVALLVSACGGSSSNGGGSATAGTPTTATKLYMIPKFTGIPPFTQADQGAQQFAQQFGYQLTYGGPTTSSATQQVQFINNATANGYKAIFISAASPAPVTPALPPAHHNTFTTP